MNIEWLENKQRDIGDSVAKVVELQKEMDEFEEKALVSSKHFRMNGASVMESSPVRRGGAGCVIPNLPIW